MTDPNRKKLKQALELVIELAYQSMADEEDRPKENEKQGIAIEIVQAHLDTL